MRSAVETGTAVALGSALAFGSGVSAETSEQEINSAPILPTTVLVQFPECNPFYYVDQGLQANPIDPVDFKPEFDQIINGEIITDEEIGEDRPYTYNDLPYGAYKYVTENPHDASIKFGLDEEVLTELPTPAEIMAEALGEDYCPSPEVEVFPSPDDSDQEDIAINLK